LTRLKNYIFTGEIFINAKSRDEAWDNFFEYMEENLTTLDDEFEIKEIK